MQSMNRDTFLDCLYRSGLFPGQAGDEVVSHLPASDRGMDLARALVAQGLLTRFQARQLLRGKFNRLVLGPYRILEMLGRGGMGRVFKAVHEPMARTVALKLVTPGLLKDGRALALFRREVRTTAQLHHPHIATAFDADEIKGVHYLVMEYVKGPSLHQLVQEQGPPPLDLTCTLISQAAQALQQAHENGVVHRDIKPANLLIGGLTGWRRRKRPPTDRRWTLPSGQSPTLKVVDFGLAGVRSGSPAGRTETILARTGNVLGTLDYISPEQADDVHAADIRSDLYSLGCTFYFALTGTVPFPDCSPLSKIAKHLLEQPSPVQTLRPEVPAAIATILQTLLAKDRNQRYQTPAELVQALAPWCGPGTAQAPPTVVDLSLPEAVPADAEAGPIGCPVAATSDDSSTFVPLGAKALVIDPDLWQKWQDWTSLVAVSVRRRGARRWVDPCTFRLLQTDLVRACRAQAEASEGETRQLFHKLEELVAPWVTPESLMQTELEIHLSLLSLCQQARENLAAWARSRSPQPEGGKGIVGGILRRWIKSKR